MIQKVENINSNHYLGVQNLKNIFHLKEPIIGIHEL